MANTINTKDPEILLKELIDGTLTDFEDDNVTILPNHALRNCTSLTRIHLPNLTSVGTYVFGGLPNVEIFHFDKITLGNEYLFTGGNSNKIIVLPGLTGGTHALNRGSGASWVDFGPLLTNLESDCFYQGHNYNIILRSPNLVTAQSTNSFGMGTGGGVGGMACYHSVFYIPKILYDHLGDGSELDYQAATNWSTAYTTLEFTFQPIEGSRYQFFYADGTLIEDNPDQITVSYNNNYIPIYENMDIKYLKDFLTVTATFGQKTVIVDARAYQLEGRIQYGTQTITAKIGNQTATFNITVQLAPELPNGYTQLMAIYSGGAAYIDTTIGENILFTAEYAFKETSRTAGNAAGHILTGTNVTYPKIYMSTNPTLNAKCGTSSGQTVEFTNWQINTIYKIIADFEDSGNIVVNGENMMTLTKGTTFDSSKKLYLFAAGSSPTTASYRFTGYLYYMKLYKNNMLIHNYIPCKNPENVVGLYDTQTRTFYGSSSSTAFVAY